MGKERVSLPLDTANIHVSTITETVKRLCIQAATKLPQDVIKALKSARENESTQSAKDLVDMILNNACIAYREGIPICQDTGLCHVFVEIGQDVILHGGLLSDAICEGVAKGYKEGYLRKSVVKQPLTTRENTGDNTPPVIHQEIVPGNQVRLTVFPKGTGSENMSALKMLTPAEGVSGVIDFVTTTVKNAGPNACPPMVVGVGIGGMMDKCTYLAKKALIRPIGSRSDDCYLASLEAQLEERLNKLGFGPAGLGGRTTVLAVHIEQAPTHIGALPVAVNLQCHAARRASAVITENKLLTDGEDWLDVRGGSESQSWHDAKELQVPFRDPNILETLSVGDKVLISGTLYTARDSAHRRLVELLEKGERLPIELKDQIIYYAGPCPPPPGAVIGSLGPTTSSRMDPYTPSLLEAGLRGMIGKGKRNQRVVESLKKYKAIYFIAVGGAGALLSKTVKKAQVVAYPELGPEAIYKLEVVRFPAVVGVDVWGNQLYDCTPKLQ
jgi:fumarate hydratase class I